MTEFRVLAHPDARRGDIVGPGLKADCMLGRGGVIAAGDKREGDGATPLGCYPLRWLYVRADRLAVPKTGLAVRPLVSSDGWCDDPDHGDYNRPVTLPHPARCERLWRTDAVYDLILVIGHNDDPVVPGMGSAIFVHLMRPDRRPTAGCVALQFDAMTALLAQALPGDSLRIEKASA